MVFQRVAIFKIDNGTVKFRQDTFETYQYFISGYINLTVPSCNRLLRNPMKFISNGNTFVNVGI